MQLSRARFITLAVLFLLTAPAARAESPILSQDHLRIFYYREGKEARASLFKYPKSIDVLAPQTYSIGSAGILVGSIKPDILAFAKNHKIKVMPLITNQGFGKAGLAVLDSTEKQDALIQGMILEAENHGYWGWQFDFEGMELSYRDSYSRFIERASKAFREKNLAVSVAVIAQVSENPEDYPKNLWQRIIGVYDYKSLAGSADFLSIMSYDDPESKGPIARYSWLTRVIEHTLTVVPKEKISLGIPLYYWSWNNATEKLIDIGGYKTMLKVFNRYRTTVSYDYDQEAPYVLYTKNGNKYKLWYENMQSIRKKLSLISKYDLMGFSAWALGLEVPTIHNVVKKGI